MRSPEEMKALFEMARENSLPWIEVDGVKMPIPAAPRDPSAEPASPEISLDPCAGYTDEEILFWSTPRFDELEAIKEEKKKHLDGENAERNPK